MAGWKEASLVTWLQVEAVIEVTPRWAHVHMATSLDSRRQGAERPSVLPRVAGPVSAELLASRGLPEAQGPFSPACHRLCRFWLLASGFCRFKRQAQSPRGTNPVTSEQQQMGSCPAVSSLSFLRPLAASPCPLMAEKWLPSRAQICPGSRCLLGARRFAQGLGRLLAPVRTLRLAATLRPGMATGAKGPGGPVSHQVDQEDVGPGGAGTRPSEGETEATILSSNDLQPPCPRPPAGVATRPPVLVLGILLGTGPAAGSGCSLPWGARGSMAGVSLPAPHKLAENQPKG